jgi:hypothetical protein
VVVAVWQARRGLAWLTWLEQLPHNVSSQWFNSLVPPDLFNSGAGSLLSPLVLISAVSALALVGCVVVYFASEKQ